MLLDGQKDECTKGETTDTKCVVGPIYRVPGGHGRLSCDLILGVRGDSVHLGGHTLGTLREVRMGKENSEVGVTGRTRRNSLVRTKKGSRK